MRPIRATRVSAIHELPAELPEAEHVLWQGAPAWWQLARSLHIRVVAGYFAVVLAWYGLDGLAHHTPDLMHGLARMAALAACATALFAAYALLVARFTSYTLTNRRLVLQVGIALPISFNIPYSRIAAAAVRPTGGDSGDIVLTLQPGEKLGYFVIWPHARPWRMKHAEPMLRALPEVSRVSRILVPLLTASTAEPVAVSAMADAASPSPQGASRPRPLPPKITRMASTAGAPPILPAGSFPRAPLWGALGLVVLALLLALTGRLTGSTVIPTGVAPAAARDLRFLDRDDGGIDVIDAANGHRIETVTGQSGFLRGTVRGLASQRKRAGLSRDEPFRLTSWRDGRLTLDDPTDARHVELEAFGPSNEGVFAEILAHPEALAPTSKPAP